ncbi:MAG: hypothetical protein J6J07_05385 [Oscillospiraceae bacterium]|nr:hypothetical protein [Lachnospiraceae bacterium]MBQ5322855.1 hypothetical protein [Oscillospiraceae bacterium]
MDIAGISQIMGANYESNKVGKENEKKNTEITETKLAEGAAAEYEKSEASESKKAVKYDAVTIEKMKAEAELKTAQLRSLVEKMLLKQGEKFTTLADAFDMIKDGTIEVDDETAAEAAKEVADDGYWGVEQTSERLFSFAKALAGNDPTKADSMLDALQKGFDEATKAWGGELPEICQKTLEATQKKITDWRDGVTAETAAPDAAVSGSTDETAVK